MYRHPWGRSAGRESFGLISLLTSAVCIGGKRGLHDTNEEELNIACSRIAPSSRRNCLLHHRARLASLHITSPDLITTTDPLRRPPRQNLFCTRQHQSVRLVLKPPGAFPFVRASRTDVPRPAQPPALAPLPAFSLAAIPHRSLHVTRVVPATPRARALSIQSHLSLFIPTRQNYGILAVRKRKSAHKLLPEACIAAVLPVRTTPSRITH